MGWDSMLAKEECCFFFHIFLSISPKHIEYYFSLVIFLLSKPPDPFLFLSAILCSLYI